MHKLASGGSDFVTIDTNDGINTITVFNTLGQKVYQGNEKQISTSNFSQGLYVLQIEFENKIVVKEKILKN